MIRYILVLVASVIAILPPIVCLLLTKDIHLGRAQNAHDGKDLAGRSTRNGIEQSITPSPAATRARETSVFTDDPSDVEDEARRGSRRGSTWSTLPRVFPGAGPSAGVGFGPTLDGDEGDEAYSGVDEDSFWHPARGMAEEERLLSDSRPSAGPNRSGWDGANERRRDMG